MADLVSSLRPGDRVTVTHKEFPEWKPTAATVLQLGIKFPASMPPIRRLTMKVRLDEHPFPEVLWCEPMRDFSFVVGDPNIGLEIIDG